MIEEGADWSAFEAEQGDFWDSCKLVTVLTDPPRHELKLPGGQVLRLRTPHFFDVERFTIAFVDAVGSFPPLPDKKPGPFLREKFRSWLERRGTKVVAEEAGDLGTLLGDIRMALHACPETDDPRDMDRGAIYAREDGAFWVSARILLERVRRACPVKFGPGDFYSALSELGAKNLDVQRDGAWRGRAWSLPKELRPEAPALPPAATPTNGTTPHTEPDGLFDDLIR